MSDQLTQEEQAWSLYRLNDGRFIEAEDLPGIVFGFNAGFRANPINEKLVEALENMTRVYIELAAGIDSTYHFVPDMYEVVQARAALDLVKQFKSE